MRGRARQYFEITDKGSGAVQLEAERLAQAAEAVQKAMRARAGRQKAGARRSAPGRTPAPGLPCRTPAIA